MFKALIGKAPVAPFKSSPELITTVQRGDVDVGFDYLAPFAPSLSDKPIRQLASAGEKRSSLTPDTPTVIESGLPGYVVTSWNGIAAPTGTPQEVVARLNQEISLVLALPEMRELFEQLGMEPAISTPEGMAERLQKDVLRLRGIITKPGLQQWGEGVCRPR